MKIKVKKDSDWNDTRLSQMINSITDEQFYFIDDYEMELKIKKLKKKKIREGIIN